MFGGKVDKPISFDEMLVLSSHMSKGSKVRCEKNCLCKTNSYGFLLQFSLQLYEKY